jgi:membrane protein implicated in regulation of membrane protease activity
MVAGQTYWINYWIVAVPGILGFARPPEEPISLGLAITLADVVLIARGNFDLAALHIAPLIASSPLVLTAGCVAVVVALRSSVVRARLIREETRRLEYQTQLAAAARQERQARLNQLDRRTAPLLEDIAEGRRLVSDPRLAIECQQLAYHLRAQQSPSERSLL